MITCSITVRHRRLSDAMAPILEAITHRGGQISTIERLIDEQWQTVTSIRFTVPDAQQQQVISGALRSMPHVEVLRIDDHQEPGMRPIGTDPLPMPPILP